MLNYVMFMLNSMNQSKLANQSMLNGALRNGNYNSFGESYEKIYILLDFAKYLSFQKVVTQLAQRRCDNVVTTSWLTLSQRCGTVEN